MSIQFKAQAAMSALANAFAPHRCQFMAATRKGGFSFTLVSESGVARHSERLYPEQYLGSGRLEQVIERARRSLTA